MRVATQRRGRTAPFSVLISLALVLQPIRARADDPVARQVEQLASDANQAYRAYDFQRAVDLLERAFQLRQVPALLYNLAKAYERLGNNDKAIEAYRRYTDSDDADPKLRAKAEARIAAYSESRPPREGPREGLEAPRSRPERPRVSTPRTVEPARPSPQDEALRLWQARRSRDRKLGPALFGVGGGLALAGLGLSVSALVIHQDFGTAGLEAEKRAARDSARTQAISADVLFGAAAVFAAVGSYYLWRGYHRENPPKLSLSPWLSRESGGLVVGGSF